MANLQQKSKSFLRKMVVVRQDFLDSAFAHHTHRNTIGQTVALIQAVRIQFQALQKG
jgi:hypothetical protein